MSAIPKKKLCWNCEGRVAFSDENCPFCGVYISSSALINQDDESSTHIAQFPSYRQDSDKAIPIHQDQEQMDEKHEHEEDLDSSQESSFLSFALLLAGSIFFTFGLILFMFSKEGTLTLQWNANYWFIYLGAAVLLFFTGWRSMRHLN